MLSQLHIENVAVIELADIDFNSGFSVLTGETGAGKSILIDSINMLLGERISKDIIRTGCNKALVSASFNVSNSDTELIEVCSQYGIEPEDGLLLLHREVLSDGRSVARINGRQCTVTVLRAIGRLLVNLHGQQDSALLLNQSRHMSFLDCFAKNDEQRASYLSAYETVCNIKAKLASVSGNEEEKARRTDLLNYMINEIETSDISVGEEAELISRRKILMNAEKINDMLAFSWQVLKDDQENVSDMLSEICKSISGVANVSEDLSSLYDKAENAVSAVDDLSDMLREMRNGFDFNQQELDDIESRLDLLSRLKKKYGSDEAKILEFLDKAKIELDTIVLSDETRISLEKELAIAEMNMKKTADILTESRVIAAKDLDKRIISELSFLEMPNTKFITDISSCDYSRSGANNVEFLLSVNIGEKPRPLSKIASGGELSRIMLGIRSVLSDADNVDTLIFDEIDTGVSGRAAQKIAVKMREMSSAKQVIAVTHLAQIAAYSHNHFLIEKHSDGKRTYTDVSLLDKNGRINEISRILGGIDITQSVIAAASEMIEKANK